METFTPVDRLTEFARWWMGAKAVAPPLDNLYMLAGCNTGIVLYRQPPWQVQFFICNPGGEIPDHTHPNVDSYEVYVGGDLYFRHLGKTIITPKMVEAGIDPLSLYIRVIPTDSHGASVGPRGGAFLSIQEWLNGEAPTSVHLDWSGEPLDVNHELDLFKARGE